MSNDDDYIASWVAGRLANGRSLCETLLEFGIAGSSELTVGEAVLLIESRVRTIQETELISELVHAARTGNELTVAELLAAGVRWDGADCEGKPATPSARTAIFIRNSRSISLHDFRHQCCRARLTSWPRRHLPNVSEGRGS